MRIMARSARQLDLDLRETPRWGGRRAGAGRECGPSPRHAHRTRRPLASRFPCHATLKVKRGLPSLRSGRLVRELESSFAAACERGAFRLVHYSIQNDHLHAIVEATNASDLASGRPPGCGARRPLPPARASNSPGGTERARLRTAQRAAASGEAGACTAARGAARPRLVREVLLRMESKIPSGLFSASPACLATAHVAAQHRLAPSRARLARGGAGRAGELELRSRRAPRPSDMLVVVVLGEARVRPAHRFRYTVPNRSDVAEWASEFIVCAR